MELGSFQVATYQAAHRQPLALPPASFSHISHLEYTSFAYPVSPCIGTTGQPYASCETAHVLPILASRTFYSQSFRRVPPQIPTLRGTPSRLPRTPSRLPRTPSLICVTISPQHGPPLAEHGVSPSQRGKPHSKRSRLELTGK